MNIFKSVIKLLWYEMDVLCAVHLYIKWPHVFEDVLIYLNAQV